jgi:hypothetical protein
MLMLAVNDRNKDLRDAARKALSQLGYPTVESARRSWRSSILGQ